jgi:RNA polymerase sigma-70 factor (ECF subfamily)
MDQFTALYDEHYRDVYRFALFLCGQPNRAEELAADTFVRAWLARDRIQQPTVRSYLLTITRNLHRDGFRGRQHVSLEETGEPAGGTPSADTQVQHRAELERTIAAIRLLAPADRQALVLRAFRDMSYADIAATLDIPVGSVKSRISRARQALKEKS